MRTLAFTTIKTVALGIALIAIFTLSQGAAQADEVRIMGSTTGSFTGTTPTLAFAGNTFDVTTSLGLANLSGTNRLGTFSLGTGSGQILAGTFTLQITFALPPGIAGGQNGVYTATVTGNVSAANSGGAVITFNNLTRSQTFTFNNAGTTGSFTLTLPDFVPVDSGNTASLQGTITGAQQNQVPEPATLLLLGTGLSGLAGMARRRRMKRARQSDEQS